MSDPPSGNPPDSGQLSRLYDTLAARLAPDDRGQLSRLYVGLTAMLSKSQDNAEVSG